MKVKIFGERHTGTNAMRMLVGENFHINVPNHGPLGWKHRRAPKKRELDKHNMDEMLVIMLVRNPYTWMDAMWRDPYNFHDQNCHKCPYEEFIRKPFEDYENLPSTWSEKNHSYFELRREVPNGIIMRMEDLAHRPEIVYETLQEWLEPKTEKVVVPKYCNGRHTEYKPHAKVREIKRNIAVPEDIHDFADAYIDSFLMAVFDYPTNRARVSV